MLGICSFFVTSITIEGDKISQRTFIGFSIFYAYIDYGFNFFLVIFLLQEMLNNLKQHNLMVNFNYFSKCSSLQNQNFHSNRNANLNLKLKEEVCAPLIIKDENSFKFIIALKSLFQKQVKT